MRFVDIDPGFVGQPNVEPDKLRKMWKKVCSKWNNVKASCRSGDTEQLIDKGEGKNFSGSIRVTRVFGTARSATTPHFCNPDECTPG